MNKIISLILLLVISACTNTPKADIGVDKEMNGLLGFDVQTENLNHQIHIYALPSDNTYKVGESLILWITNTSDSTVTFKDDYGVKLFAKVNGQWETIGNNVDYPHQEEVLFLPTDKDPYSGTPFGIYPSQNDLATKNLAGETLIRVVIAGISSDKNNNKPVAAYADITLLP